MELHPRFRTLFRLALGLLFTPLLPARTWELVDGGTVTGECIRRYGPVVHLADRSSTTLIPYGRFSPADRAEIDATTEAYRARAATDWAQSTSAMAVAVRKHLFRMEGNKAHDGDVAGRPEPELYVLYFSASWCGPCRRFTPRLTASYNVFRQMGLENFEVFFVSWDRDSRAMRDYMEADGMPWLGLNYNRGRRLKPIQKVEGNGIPCLVILDREGHVLAHSYNGSEYLGPDEPLDFLRDLLYWTNPDHHLAATTRFGRVLPVYLKEYAERASPAPFWISTGALPAGVKPASVRLRLSLDARGGVREAAVLSGLEGAAADALVLETSKWLFLPPIQHQRGVACVVEESLDRLLDGMESARLVF
jgi:thiol-disulfide isomerase/thioredoxin